MNCRTAQRLLSAERDGALASHERADLEGHVAACAECRQARSVAAAAVDHWRTAQARVALPDAERAWQDIHREIRRSTPANAAGSRWLPRWTIPIAAAAALVFAATQAPRWLHDADPSTNARPQIARADFVETAADASSMVYVDDKSGWLVVWAVSDNDKL